MPKFIKGDNMAIQVDFMVFSKVANSTAKPFNITSDNSLTAQCILKEPTDIITPVIQLTGLDSQNLYRFTYARIAIFNRFYFINSWSYNAGVWTAMLSVDAMASFRGEIGGIDAYILRSSCPQYAVGENTVTVWNYDVTDNTYPTTSYVTYDNNAIENPLQPPADDFGVYVVGVVNKNAMTGISYYIMSYLVYYSFCRQLFTLSNFGTFEDIGNSVAQAIINPFQYIHSVMWLPYTSADFYNRDYASPVQNVTVGWYNITVSGTAFLMTESKLNIEFTNTIYLQIPKHPQYSTRGNYMNLAPFSNYVLRFYPFGLIDIDSAAIANYGYLYMNYTVDLKSGHAILNISPVIEGSTAANSKINNPLRTVEAQVGVNIPVASVITDVTKMGTTQTLVTAGAAVASSGGGLVNGVKRLATTVLQAGYDLVDYLSGGANEATTKTASEVTGVQPFSTSETTQIVGAAMSAAATVEVTGMQGTISGYKTQQVTLSGRFLMVVADNVAKNGRPVCAVHNIAKLVGHYVQCSHNDYKIEGAFPRELQIIQQNLTGGFYFI